MGAFDFDQPTLNADEAQEKLEQPSNESGQYQIPHWSDWNQERQEAFKKIAGDYLDNYDYTW